MRTPVGATIAGVAVGVLLFAIFFLLGQPDAGDATFALGLFSLIGAYIAWRSLREGSRAATWGRFAQGLVIGLGVAFVAPFIVVFVVSSVGGH